MQTMTITEALAEIKTLGKRIEKKREFIRANAARQEMLKDPLASEGGSKAAVTAALQAVEDLESNVVKIRTAIARANLNTHIMVAGVTGTVSEWLSWRRDVAPARQQFLRMAAQGIEQIRREAAQKGFAIAKEGEQARPQDIVVSLDEAKLHAAVEELETILGTLDGQLSLKNATTTIEF